MYIYIYIYTHIYMESRKIILMNLFAERNGNTDIENRLSDIEEEGEDRTN